MASMNPNPFLAPASDCARPAQPRSRGLAPRASEASMALAPTVPVVPFRDVAAAAASRFARTKSVAAPSSKTPTPVPISARWIPTPAPSSTSGITMQTLPPRPPEMTGSIRTAFVRLRRAQLTRVVKGVVFASLLVCVAALGRGLASAMTTDAVPHGAILATRAIEDVAHPIVIDANDTLSERTVRAMTTPATAARRAPARSAAARHHRR